MLRLRPGRVFMRGTSVLLHSAPRLGIDAFAMRHATEPYELESSRSAAWIARAQLGFERGFGLGPLRPHQGEEY